MHLTISPSDCKVHHAPWPVKCTVERAYLHWGFDSWVVVVFWLCGFYWTKEQLWCLGAKSIDGCDISVGAIGGKILELCVLVGLQVLFFWRGNESRCFLSKITKKFKSCFSCDVDTWCNGVAFLIFWSFVVIRLMCLVLGVFDNIKNQINTV